jgi:DNA-binding transcriptional ArsR family regulator
MADTNAAFAALADPTRRAVFERLASGPRSVGELAQGLPVSRPAVSQHLKVLREAGLVDDRADGARRVYSIDPAGLGVVRAWLDRFWSVALEAFVNHVETITPTRFWRRIRSTNRSASVAGTCSTFVAMRQRARRGLPAGIGRARVRPALLRDECACRVRVDH